MKNLRLLTVNILFLVICSLVASSVLATDDEFAREYFSIHDLWRCSDLASPLASNTWILLQTEECGAPLQQLISYFERQEKSPPFISPA